MSDLYDYLKDLSSSKLKAIVIKGEKAQQELERRDDKEDVSFLSEFGDIKTKNIITSMRKNNGRKKKKEKKNQTVVKLLVHGPYLETLLKKLK